jgi:hypothetical protein
MKIQINDIVKSLDFVHVPDLFVVGKVVAIRGVEIDIEVTECSHGERQGTITTTVMQGHHMLDSLGERIFVIEAAPVKHVVQIECELFANVNYALVELDKARAAMDFIAKNVSPEVLEALKAQYNFDFVPVEF